MRIDDGATTIQLVEHRPQPNVTQPHVAVAREKADAIRLQRVERILDLAQAGVDVRQRQDRKEPEAPLVVRHHSSAVLVHVARQRDGVLPLALEVVAEPDARFGAGQKRCLRPAFVHRLDRSSRSVVLKRLPPLALRLGHALDPSRRAKVVVQVENPARGRRRPARPLRTLDARRWQRLPPLPTVRPAIAGGKRLANRPSSAPSADQPLCCAPAVDEQSESSRQRPLFTCVRASLYICSYQRVLFCTSFGAKFSVANRASNSFEGRAARI